MRDYPRSTMARSDCRAGAWDTYGMTRVLHAVAATALLAGLLFMTAGCRPGAGTQVGIAPPDDSLEQGDTRHEALADADVGKWITVCEPEACFNGYTLALFRRRIPMLVDLNGRIVHSWPRVRAVARTRLNPDGTLTVDGVDNYLKEYSWGGRLDWYYRPANEEDLLHHDFFRLANGNYLLLLHEAPGRLDKLIEVDRSKRVVWSWRIADHLGVDLPQADRSSHDPTHCNSVQELPPNPHFAAGDERFRPGNILVSARNLNCIFVIDRETGKVAWRYEDSLDYQHEARMIASGNVGEGLIVVFDNGYNNREAYRRSSVLAIDPVERRVVWRYAADGFFSSVAGTAQPLPNGNALISSSQGGRIFEITTQGHVVWQLEPPYLPMRARRYPADYCPQLERLKPQPLHAVARSDTRPFIDQELYAYTLPEEHQTIRDFHGKTRRLVREPSSCRVLWLPPRPQMVLAYGLDAGPLGPASVKGLFRATLEPLAGGRLRVLLDDEVDSSDQELWRERSILLDGLGYQKVRLCLDARWEGDLGERQGDRIVRWQSPWVGSRVKPKPTPEPELDRERKLRAQQLKTIGYLQ